MNDRTVREIVYYPGCFATYWDPETARAVVRVLERHSFRVTVPRHQCCGISRIGHGDYESACKSAKNLVDRLYGFTERGLDIITSCPSCNLAIREEYPAILQTDKAAMVSARTMYIGRLITILGDNHELDTHFSQIAGSVAYHAPCHLRAQCLEGDTLNMMKLVAGDQVIDLDRGCCGMAGTFGLHRAGFDASMTMAAPLLERIRDERPRLVATDCGSCKMQIGQCLGIRIVHPLVLLDASYPD